jgi:D-lactate dehydrogenase
MERKAAGSENGRTYDVMHFEAMGEEAHHLEEETERALRAGDLPKGLRYFITPSTVQEYLAEEPKAALPRLVTIKTHSRLPDSYFAGTRKSVVTRSAGYDHMEEFVHTANIASLREYCVNAVAQTAMKFLYAAAGELNRYERNAATFRRNDAPSFMELDENKILTVFGVGKIGKKIYDLAEANGLGARGVDIRQAELAAKYGGTIRFVSMEEAFRESDIIVNAMNLTIDPKRASCNVGYFSKDRLSTCKKGLIFINMTRGEIAPEAGLLELYESGLIGGLGIDVFSRESALAASLSSKELSPDADIAAAKAMIERSLRRDANIYVQPHQAFNSDKASATKAREAIRHLVAWYRNEGDRFDEQLPYYG